LVDSKSKVKMMQNDENNVVSLQMNIFRGIGHQNAKKTHSRVIQKIMKIEHTNK